MAEIATIQERERKHCPDVDEVYIVGTVIVLHIHFTLARPKLFS